ncbi:hypothetical protein KZ483_08985 [Paenibacillus sp. sptzw28]|uniref:hypothetical protein n=1 Tax=Paenibacillus sp. sptzw28 TaxID=715179 RepID=UPI001C6EBA8D|nr:hypothetical protein [Paenibacillus sp. sptzw28]QYR23037.1 hypothetical protein KZ483_08985 [Paenibacillus sp. sptzw28]
MEANDTYVVDLHRGWGEYDGHKIDLNWIITVKIENGKIVEAYNYIADQHQVDDFFWKVYPLKPIPERLEE